MKQKEYSRNYCFILYPDNPKHLDIMNTLPMYRYISIFHDRGLENDDDAGQDRKKHYHVLIRFENKRSKEKLVNDLGIEENLVRVCGNPDGYMLYMLHKGYEGKEQYSVNELIGDQRLIKRVKKLMKAYSLDEEEKVETLINWIEDQDNIKFMDFARYALSCGHWDVVKRSQYFFRSLIIEHNEDIYEAERLNDINPFLKKDK